MEFVGVIFCMLRQQLTTSTKIRSLNPKFQPCGGKKWCLRINDPLFDEHFTQSKLFWLTTYNELLDCF
jgi:hypothetical protein